ncbi:MAG: DUF4097 family beta strand repeat protein [Calditrichia bacterium]|nr:DUF4097 family beta strand repeat protein [Calditrichia bacterium]
MKNFKLISVLVLLPIFLFAQDKVKKEIETEPGKTLDIELTTGGSIEVTGWDKNLVSIIAHIRGDKEDYYIDVDERSSGIKIEVSYEGRHRHNGGVSVDVHVPTKYNLELETMGGDIMLKGIEGSFSGETMGGEIELYHLKGEVDLTTMGGEIQVEDCDLDGQVKTMGGEISLRDVIGDLDASTMGGEVSYRNVKRRDEREDAREVKISTMGGEIEVDDAPGGANVSTMGGEIRIRSAKKYVKAKTMGGEIKIDKIDGGVKATTMGGDIEVNMVGDPDQYDRDVVLSSMGGDIILTVPSGLSMDFDIKLTITHRSSADYKIISDFPIDIEKSGDWDYSDRSARRFIYGTGKVAGGKNKIRIDTVNGDIIIKKGK